MERRYAYSFRSKLTLDEILARLNEIGPWQWRERWNDAWGAYLFARMNPAPHNAVVKLIADDGYYVVNVKQRSEQPGGQAEYAAVHQKLMDELLPAIQARGVKPTDYYE